MTLSWVRGPILNVFTAFDADGRLDVAGQRNLFAFSEQSGVISAYFVRSGMGQMYAYEAADVELMARLAAEHFGGTARFLLGAAGIWDRNFDRRPDPQRYLDQAIQFTKLAAELGAAGTVHVVPEAIAPRAGETHGDVILQHVAAITKACSLPLFLYQPPPILPEYRITPGLATELAQLSNVKGMKLSSADAGYLLDIAEATRDTDFSLICGDERAFLAGLACGARAVIGQGCCLYPALLNAVQEQFEAGDLDGARRTQGKVNALCREVTAAVPFFKRYASDSGYPVPPYARSGGANPYAEQAATMSEAEYARWKAAIESALANLN